MIWNANGTERINSLTANRILEEANNRFLEANSGIQFYQKQAPLHSTNANYADAITGNEFDQMALAWRNPNHITIHLTGGGIGGAAFLPNTLGKDRSLYVGLGPTFDGITLSQTILNYTLQEIGGVLAHELGHALGLLHTHDVKRSVIIFDHNPNTNAEVANRCFQESVNNGRTNTLWESCGPGTIGVRKCEINGDGLCDTEADPDMTFMLRNDSRTQTRSFPIPNGTLTLNPCNVAVDPNQHARYRQDLYNEAWNPNFRNIMGYGNRICRNFFSEGQIGVMEYYLDNSFSNLPTQMLVEGPSNLSCIGINEFTIPAIHNVNISWIVSSNLSINSQLGNKVQVSALNPSSNGTGWVRAEININGCTIVTPNKEVWMGTPPPAHTSIIYVNGFYGQNPVSLSKQALYDFNYQPIEGAQSYHWEVPTGFSIYSGQGTSNAKIQTNNTNGNYVIKCYPTNSCGTYGYQSLYVIIGNNGGGGGGGPIGPDPCPEPPCIVPQPLRISPNPANSSFEINSEEFSIGKEENELEYALYNYQQKKIIQLKSKERRVIIQTANLPEGYYILHIVGDRINERRRIQIVH